MIKNTILDTIIGLQCVQRACIGGLTLLVKGFDIKRALLDSDDFGKEKMPLLEMQSTK